MPSTERFVLRFRGHGAKPDADVSAIRALPNTTILDDSADRMLLVEAPAAELQAAVGRLRDWIVVPELPVPLPDTKKKIERD